MLIWKRPRKRMKIMASASSCRRIPPRTNLMRTVFLFALLALTPRLAPAQKGTATTPASDPTNFLSPGSQAARMGSRLNFAPSGHHQGWPRFSPWSFLTDPFWTGLPRRGDPPKASSPAIRLPSAADNLAPPGDQGPQQGQPLL